MNNESVLTHFSNLAEQGVWASLYQPGAQVNAENSSFLVRARRVMQLLTSTRQRPREVFDLGCGTAPLGSAILAMGSRYTGVDFSAEMIDAACRQLGQSVESGSANLAVGDARKLNIRDGKFDATIAMGLVEYFSQNDVDLVLQEIARVTRPRGIAIITIPKRWHWGRLVNWVLTPLRRAISFRPQSAELKLRRKEDFKRLLLTPGELDSAARKVGLRKTGSYHYNVQIVTGPFVWLFPRAVYLINRPFENLALIPGGSFFATGYIGRYVRL
jgi:ubiquinone/menaquinone biosynthesis C-methylase UbiE